MGVILVPFLSAVVAVVVVDQEAPFVRAQRTVKLIVVAVYFFGAVTFF